jgi:adenine-specific DNA methylase
MTKRLIEYDLPLADISEASAREKNTHRGPRPPFHPAHLVGVPPPGLLPRHRL